MSAANADPAGPAILPMGEDALGRALNELTAGHPVAVPTETVYGLAARAQLQPADRACGGQRNGQQYRPIR